MVRTPDATAFETRHFVTALRRIPLARRTNISVFLLVSINSVCSTSYVRVRLFECAVSTSGRSHGPLFALVVSHTLGCRFLPLHWHTTELTLNLAIAGRVKVVHLGLAMKFVISTLLRRQC